MAKQRLYRLVEEIRKDYGINYPPPYNSIELCTSAFGLYLNKLDLKTPKLRGMSHIPSRSVLIDSKLSEEEQNFYCMHEIIHHTVHKTRPTKLYSCYEGTQVDQNSFIEWEANEGAAQFLVPYQDFIPRFSTLLDAKTVGIPYILANYYNVTAQVINIRMDNLAYEIDQYQLGVGLEDIELLSRREREARGIKVECYPAVCDFMSFLVDMQQSEDLLKKAQ